MKKKISVEDRERIENRLREIQEQKNLKEMEHLKDGNYIGGLTMPTEPNDWWDF